LDSRLVSNENSCEILPFSGWAPGQGPGNMNQNGLTYDITHKKHKTQNQKNFFSLQTRRCVESFKGLNSSLAQSAEQLVRQPKTACFTPISKYWYIVRQQPRC